MFFCLIRIRVFRHVFQNPSEAAKDLENHPFFKKFVARQSSEAYIEGLCDSLQSLCIGWPVERPNVKLRLSEMLSESSSDEEDTPVMKKISWTSDLEGDCLPATSILSVYVAERSSSSKKKSKKKNKKKSQKKSKKH